MENNKTTTFLKGVSVTGLYTIVGGVIGIVFFAIMSRLLTKADFGYFAALTGVMAIIGAFADAGMSSAIIQKKDATPQFVSTAFTMNLILGFVCMLIVYVSAPFLANIVADDVLINPLRIMSITLLLNSFTGAAYAQMYRDLAFQRIGIIGFTSNILNTIFSIVLAISGMGLYAMVFYVTFGPLLTMILLYTTSAKMPVVRIYKEYVKGIFSFGGWLTLSVICNNIAKQVDRVLLPKLTSIEMLGAYSRPANFANNISGQITDIMDRVLFPMLSDIQDDQDKARQIFYRATELLNCVSILLACAFFFNADLIITIFFGEEWADLVSVLRIVSVTIIFLIDTQLVDCFFRSLNYVKTGFYLRVISMLWNIICIIWGCRYGIIGTAVSLAFANITIIILKMYVLSRKISASWNMTVTRWVLSWRSAIIPITVGTVFLIQPLPHTTLVNSLFALVFGCIVIIEYIGFPKMVGQEYEQTLYPYVKKIFKKK